MDGTSHEVRQGLVQVYTGNGKGKTTAALGLAFRATGSGLHTYFGQFLKGFHYGELETVKLLAEFITIEQYGGEGWVHVTGPTPEQRAEARAGLEKARQALSSGRYDIVVLDEINVACSFGLLTEEDILALMDDRPSHVELVLTGRNAPAAVIDRADLVTEMVEVRHPFNKGIKAREGIEF